MNRREFMQRCAALAAGSPFFAGLLAGCEADEGLYWGWDVTFEGKVIVIGAGAAGLAAGYILDRYGIDFEILEASGRIGGRVWRADGFADFPIDLGGEWIHQDPSVLAALIDDPGAEGAVEVVPFSPDTAYVWNNGRLGRYNWAANYYSEYKFKRSTWYGFLEDWIAPGSRDRIVYDSPVEAIDHSGSRVAVRVAGGAVYEAEAVLVTAPLKILQRGLIAFTPALPQAKQRAMREVIVPDGLKVFVRFTERFYPDVLLVGDPLTAAAQEKVIYDAAFRKGSSQNVLGLFCVGPAASEYTSPADEQAIVERLLMELDEMFDGRASVAYIDHVVQSWSAEPWIQGSYTSAWTGDDERATFDALIEPLDGRVFFAGEAHSWDNGATVPGAMESAYAVTERILTGWSGGCRRSSRSQDPPTRRGRAGSPSRRPQPPPSRGRRRGSPGA